MTSKTITKKLTPALVEELCHYFATHNAAKLSRNLRCILLGYLAHELLWQLHDLFELLDIAQQETQHWHPPPKAKQKTHK